MQRVTGEYRANDSLSIFIGSSNSLMSKAVVTSMALDYGLTQ